MRSPHTGQAGQPQQTSTVGPGTRYISLSAGGNDVGFGDLGIACVEAVVSHLKAVRIPGKSCEDQIAASKKKLAATKASLVSLYTDLLDHAQQATIVVLGYPRILPSSYKGVPRLKGSAFCVLDHYSLPHLVIDAGMAVAEAKLVDAFSRKLNATVQDAIAAVRQARPALAAQLRYADSYSVSVPHNCKGTTRKATVAALQLSLGRGASGPGLVGQLKRFIASSTLHPTKTGQALFATLVQRAFTTTPLLATTFTRQSPVTDDGAVAPGFTIVDSAPNGNCLDGSEVGQAYRCFAGNGVFDPCYAVADQGTGDGTSVVCPVSPFTNDLFAVQTATGLGRLDASTFDEPNGIVLASGAKCIEEQGAHGADSHGRVVDYGCDDNRTVVLRGLHESGRLWTADAAHINPDYTYTPAGNQPIASAVMLQHDVPPANRPVTDAGNATVDEFDSSSRAHHEVDCGQEATTRNASPVEQIFDSGTPCSEASLVVTEWDTGNTLEAGWSCTYDDAGTLLCQQAGSVDDANAPAFFSSTHIRAITVG
jgi:hypothetical protein